jgi:hypothetical protein
MFAAACTTSFRFECVDEVRTLAKNDLVNLEDLLFSLVSGDLAVEVAQLQLEDPNAAPR